MALRRRYRLLESIKGPRWLNLYMFASNPLCWNVYAGVKGMEVTVQQVAVCTQKPGESSHCCFNNHAMRTKRTDRRLFNLR
jgi:hypothetical protein